MGLNNVAQLNKIIKHFEDPREMVVYILAEKDVSKQQMLFGYYRRKLSNEQIRYIRDHLSPILRIAKKEFGGKVSTWMDDIEDKPTQAELL